MQKSANLLGEVECPRDFELMRGYDGRTSKTCETERFWFSFGDNKEKDLCSGSDQAATHLYKVLGQTNQKL